MGSKSESTFDRLRPEELEADLNSKGLQDFSFIYKEIAESTNADVLNHYQTHEQESIAICEMQTAGKGRRGRQWVSPFAQNIYCTLGVEKSLPASQLGLVSILSGIALCQAMAVCGIPDIKLKWPNDLYFGRQKLGGILIESRPTANGSYFFAIGFGINVHMTRAQLDEIPQATTSLALISENAVDRQQVLLATIESVVEKVRSFNEIETSALIDEFELNDAFNKESICVINADSETLGRNAGINEYGQLILKTETGQEFFSAAEISLRAVD